MRDSLPKNWMMTSLKVVTRNIKGKKPKIQSETEFENSVPYMDIKALEFSEIRQYADIESSKLFEPGDVAMVWDGARSGWVSRASSGAIGSTVVAIKAIGFSSDYLYYFLFDKYRLINLNARGVGIPHVDPTILWELEFPLPPLAEQYRIVAKLDALFGQLETIKKSLENVPVLLKTFRQQVLTQAVTGKLTEEWREGKELEESKSLTIGELFEVKTGSTPKRGTKGYYENAKVPWIKSGLVKNELIFEADEFITELAVKETNAKVFPIDTLLVAMYGEGKTRGQVGWMKIEAATNQAIAALVNEKLDITIKKFVFIFCLSQYNEIRAQAEGGNQPNLNLSKIRNWSLILPPLEEQQEIVRRVESLFAKADAIEAQYITLKEKIDKLPQAILHKAFKGELTEQLDTDGDARDLLKEIEALKAGAGKTPKTKKNKPYAAIDEVKMVAEP